MSEYITKEYIVDNQKWNNLMMVSKKSGYSMQDILSGLLCEVILQWDKSFLPIYMIDCNKTKCKSVNNINICKEVERIVIDSSDTIYWSDIFMKVKKRFTSSIDTNQVVNALIIYFREMKINGELDNLEINNEIFIEEDDNKATIVWKIKKTVYSKTYEAIQHSLDVILEGYDVDEYEKDVESFIPDEQKKIREYVNNTYVEREDKLLHEEFFKYAEKMPDRVAIAWENSKYGEMKYGELRNKALEVMSYLRKLGVKEGDNVAITIGKGCNQIIAVLGILAAGACYVPIGVKQPEIRYNKICEIANIKFILTDSDSYNTFSVDSSVQLVNITDIKEEVINDDYVHVSPDNTAYIIFTSGTTGEPKGVKIAHKSAKNTIDDVLERFSMTYNDKILNISELDFDLSVFDIFGLLSIGGSIFVLNEMIKKEATVWSKFIEKYCITIWNSVPAFFEMLLVTYGKQKIPSSLRIALLSGDWVRCRIYNLLKSKSDKCRLIALGGATEASIWSNFFEVKSIDEKWTSIPYGTPLGNQGFRIVDKHGRYCPDYVPGEIQIGGKGLAQGYIRNTELTEEKFIGDSSGRWYCTGDMGQYCSNGNIEFLGREDYQVKVRGFRIELDEISKSLECYDGIKTAVTVKVDSGKRQYLASAIIGEVSSNNKSIRIRRNADESNVKNVIEEQTQITMLIIDRLLGLTDTFKINNEISISNLMNRADIDYSKKNIIDLWIEWLCEKEILSLKGNILSKGKEYESLLNIDESVKAESFVKKIGLFKDILSNKISELELLNDEEISPEVVSSKEKGIIAGSNLIIEKINSILEGVEEPLNIAILEARTGIVAEKIISQKNGSNIRWTIFDDAKSMVESARRRLEGYEDKCDFSVLPDDFVPEEFRYKYDVVITINSLHTHLDLEAGINNIASLLKKDGIAYTLELREVPPVSLITSALLENGYAEYTTANRPNKNNPMLNGKQWCTLFLKYGFDEADYEPISGTLFEIIEVKGQEKRKELHSKKILEYISGLLPDYMIPDKFVFLYKLPLNKNGKVDHPTIMSYFEKEQVGAEKIEPQTEMEIKVSEIWQSILGIKEIGINQSFFEMGGDSLLATHFISIVNENFGLQLSMKEMFENPTLFEIAKILEKRNDLQKEGSEEEMEFGEI